jgi:hypothetical protein
MKANTRTTAQIVMSFLASVACLSGCKTLGAQGGPSGMATTEQLQARNKALEDLVGTALKPCETKLKPEDTGLIVVSARPDGSLALGPMQWLGSEETKQCIQTEAPKARLAAWQGPTVTWMWAVGNEKNPAPKGVENPASYGEKQNDLLRQAQGGGAGTEGPLGACVQSALPPEAYARVTLRLFVFPDGKVVGVTPWANEGEGKDAAFQECLAKIPREWAFQGFTAPGFTVLDVSLNTGQKSVVDK